MDTSLDAKPDRILRNGRLTDGRLVDVHVADGKVAAIVDADRSRGAQPTEVPTTDLDDWLLIGALAEPHAHLDKALTAERVPNPTGNLMGAIHAWMAAAEAGTFTHDDVVERATAAMEMLLANGVTAVRTHVNVGAGENFLRGVREAREQLGHVMDVQIVALTSNPITGPEGKANRAALAAALEIGVDLIGGCPHLDPDGTTLMADAFTAASEANIGLDFHVDEVLDADVLHLRGLARMVGDIGFENGVTASHCVTLGLQQPDVRDAVAREVAEAGIGVVALPQTNLFLQGRTHPVATPRGLTAVGSLVDAGAVVCAGADNVQDPFNLVGRSDPLETASLMVMAGHRLPDDAFRMVGADARCCMGLPPAGPEVGAVADLLAIDAPSVRGAIADAPASRRTFRRGELVASTDQTTRIHR